MLKILYLCIVISLPVNALDEKNMIPANIVESEVRAAFIAAEKGDISLTSGLLRHGYTVIDFISPYLTHNSATVKIEAIAILKAIPDDRAAQALVVALADESLEIRYRAAEAIYSSVGQGIKLYQLDKYIVEGIKYGPPDAAALLLLGYSDNGRELLREYVDEKYLVKLHSHNSEVPANLPALVGLSRLGDDSARQQLSNVIENAESDKLEFLLLVVNTIDSPSILHLLAQRSLINKKEIVDGVPVGAEPHRRLCDMAVDILTKRLKLNPPFILNPTQRYSDKDILSLHALIFDSLPLAN